ncbi:MAG: F0F1 ATP synthase subunit delta [Rhodomicrobium sp.]
MHLDLWTIALQTVNFVILAALLYRFLYQPVLGMIQARQAEVRRQYDDAKEMEEKARANLEAIASAREGIAAEREAALKAAAAQARETAEARLADARREAQALLDGVRNTLSSERERALDEARRAALDLGAEFARRLLAETPVQLRGEAWIERIEQHLSALPKPELDALVKQLANDHALTVQIAVPLPASAAETWKTRLRRSLGDGIAISFEVNPELLAGAELHFPDAILRLSWQSELTSLRSEIEAHGNAH